MQAAVGITTAEVEARLCAAIPEVHICSVEDVSDGHTESPSAVSSGKAALQGGREYKVLIVSDAFVGLSALERSRMVHEQLSSELHSGVIHSLPALRAWTPAQLADCQKKGIDPRCTDLMHRPEDSTSGSKTETADGLATEAVLDFELKDAQAKSEVLRPAQTEVTNLELEGSRDTTALSVIVRANNGQERRLRFAWLELCAGGSCVAEGPIQTIGPSDRVLQLKERIADLIGMPMSSQHLVAHKHSSQSDALADQMRLDSLGLAGGSVLWLQRR
eukprot:SAG31_NODE_2596_length_5420_cov_45.220330_3_plen_275_part_00